jgi:uncharacterized protein DUF3617
MFLTDGRYLQFKSGTGPGAPPIVSRIAAGGVRLRALLPGRWSLIRVLCALALLPAPAVAEDYPKLKPGLWEMERASERAQGGPSRMTMCLDESVQKEMFDIGAGAMKGMCSKHDFKLSGNRGTADFVCDIAGSRMHSQSTMVLNGNTGYRTEIRTTYDPPFMGQTENFTVLTARHVGACKPGQRPGDMVLPNGQTINMRDAMRPPPGGPPGAAQGRPPAGARPPTDRQPG